MVSSQLSSSDVPPGSPLDRLSERLGYRFQASALLRQAVTHRSYGATHYERLEFLGDAVLNCVVSTLLYQRFPSVAEGDLSRVRANLVRQETLHGIAQTLSISTVLTLGEGELRSGGKERPSILADAVEALFGAIYLDGGFPAAFDAIDRAYAPVFATLDADALSKDTSKDAKTLLQERLQARQLPLPVYTVVATSGAAHNQAFEVSCAIARLQIDVHGHGASRRAAETAAARLALTHLGEPPPKAAGNVAVVRSTVTTSSGPSRAAAGGADADANAVANAGSAGSNPARQAKKAAAFGKPLSDDVSPGKASPGKAPSDRRRRSRSAQR